MTRSVCRQQWEQPDSVRQHGPVCIFVVNKAFYKLSPLTLLSLLWLKWEDLGVGAAYGNTYARISN